MSYRDEARAADERIVRLEAEIAALPAAPGAELASEHERLVVRRETLYAASPTGALANAKTPPVAVAAIATACVIALGAFFVPADGGVLLVVLAFVEAIAATASVVLLGRLVRTYRR